MVWRLISKIVNFGDMGWGTGEGGRGKGEPFLKISYDLVIFTGYYYAI